jgi:hypothetical protein
MGWMARQRAEAPERLEFDIVFVYSNIGKVN